MNYQNSMYYGNENWNQMNAQVYVMNELWNIQKRKKILYSYSNVDSLESSNNHPLVYLLDIRSGRER